MAKHMSYYQFQTDDSIKWKNTFSMAGLKVKNRLNANVSNVVVAFAQSPLSTNIDWKLVDVSNKINMISSTIFYVMKLSNGKTSHEPFKRDIKKDGENKKQNYCKVAFVYSF